MENNNPDTFFIDKRSINKTNKEVKNMIERFVISTVVENGHPHYKILDCKSGKEIHCDFGELNSTLYELMGN